MPDTTTTQRQQCRHIHADGRRCGSPCLRHEPFCYFHHTSRKPLSRPLERKSRRSAFDLPLPEDRTSIQLAIGEIARRIASNDVDPRRAGLLLYALQIASTNLSQARHEHSTTPPALPVEDLTLDPTLGPLAPPAPSSPPAPPAPTPPSPNSSSSSSAPPHPQPRSKPSREANPPLPPSSPTSTPPRLPREITAKPA